MQVNDEFTLEKIYGGWALTQKYIGKNKKTGEEKEQEYTIYPASLLHCCERMMELKAGDASTLEEIITNVQSFKKEIINWLKEADLGRLITSSEREEGDNRRIKAANKNEKSNDGNEGKGVERKVQVRQVKSRKVSPEIKEGTGRKRGRPKKKV